MGLFGVAYISVYIYLFLCLASFNLQCRMKGVKSEAINLFIDIVPFSGLGKSETLINTILL